MRKSLSTKNLVLMALLIALSAVGAYIKLGPGSIALDAAAGFVAALVLGPAAGAIVCGIGHLASAAVSGFPLTISFHLVVALAMAGVGAVGGLVAKRFGIVAGAVALVAANGVGAPGLLALVPNPLGTGLFMALVAPLTLAAAVNAAVALVVATAIRRMRRTA